MSSGALALTIVLLSGAAAAQSAGETSPEAGERTAISEDPDEEYGAYESPTTPEDELADAPPPAKRDVSGLGLTMTAGPAFSFESTHQWNDGTDCPEASYTYSVPGEEEPRTATWTAGCSANPPIGFLLDVRLSYMFNFFGIEAFALGAGDWSSANVEDLPEQFSLPSYLTQMHIGRIGGGLGGGVRLKTPPGFARLSAGIGGGIMFRHVYTNISSLDGSSDGYTAPIVRADVGVVLLNFLTVGLMGWVEYTNSVGVDPDLDSLNSIPPQVATEIENALGNVTVFQGNQTFLGIFAGLSMGK